MASRHSPVLPLVVVLSACSGPASSPTPPPTTTTALVSASEPVPPVEPPPPATQAPAGPLRWQDYDCTVIGPWQPGPSLEAQDAPPDAESSDVVGWYAEGRVGRLYRWRARGAAMGELRWLRWDGTRWVESGSGARRWPRGFDAASQDTVVVAAPRFAVLAHRGGPDNRFLDTMWVVSDGAAPRRLRFGRTTSVGGAVVTSTGEVHLHLTGFRYGGEQLLVHLAADGAEIARRALVVETDGETTRSLGGSAEGLLEAIPDATRLHPYDAAQPALPLSLVPRFEEPYMQLASGVAPCSSEEGLRFSAYQLGMGFAPVEDMLVTYEVSGTDTCVRSVRVPLYGSGGELDCERCDLVLDARDGSLTGSALSSAGLTREVHCATAPGSTEPYPTQRTRAPDPER